MRFIAYLLLALTALVTLPGLGERDFWPPDEARYGSIAQEMMRGDHHGALRLNAEAYGDKPPGYFWLVRLATHLRGEVDEWALRFPSALGALLFVLFVGLHVGRATGAQAGFLAGLLPLATWSFAWQARMAQLDLLFAALATAAALDGFRALEAARPRLFWRAGLWLGLAIVVKGPLALLVLVLLQLWAWFSKPERAEGHRLWPAVLVMLGLMLVPALIWLGLAISEAGWPFVRDELFLRNVVERAGKGLAHVQPWHFYLRRVPVALLPWLLFAPLLLLPSARALIGREGRRLAAFCSLWILLFLGLQSAFPGKRSIYAFLFFAPIFVLVAQAAAATTSEKAGRGARLLSGLLVIFVTLLLGAIAALFGWAAFSDASFLCLARDLESCLRVDLAATFRDLRLPWPGDEAFPELRRRLLTPALAAALGALLALIDLARRRLGPALEKAALGFAFLFLALLAQTLPELDAARSRRALAEELQGVVGEAEVAIYRHLDEGLLFYFGRPLPELDGDIDAIPEGLDPVEHKAAVRAAADLSLEEWLKVPQHRFLVVRRKDREAFAETIAGRRWTLRAGDRVGSDTEFEVLEFDLPNAQEER